MVLEYCVYQNKFYRFDMTDDGEIELTSSNIQDKSCGFTEYVDVLGEINRDIFVKVVKENDLEMAYELRVNAIYNEREFEIKALGNFSLEENKVTLISMDSDDVERYGFEMKEQFVYVKEVSLDSLDSFFEINTPILKFRQQPQIRDIIPKNAMKDYIKNLVKLFLV